jgi:aspartyl-tRNA(Asn)/glutamyl-tRNA(Gln) amidotransferase subunit A
MSKLGGWASLPVLAARVARGEISAESLTEQALDRIARHDPTLGAFLHVAADQARECAHAIDAKRRRGAPLGALAGVPLAIKDVLCTADQPTTAASRMLAPRLDGRSGSVGAAWLPPYDATVIARLRAADAVLVGKTNLDELGMGSSTEHSAFGPTRNPWDHQRTPGGSSGGSAAAVAAGLVPGALGADTGGSVRQPAAFTGSVGLKPSYGRVSRHGLIAFASSLDQVGTLTDDVRGAALLLDVIAGPDPRDGTCAAKPAPALLAGCRDAELTGLRVGVPDEYFEAGIEPEVESAVRSAIDALGRLGAQLLPLRLPHTRFAVACYYVLATAEASSNLARFDGTRFGLRIDAGRGFSAGQRREPRAGTGDGAGAPAPGEPAALYEAMVCATRGRGFGVEVKRRILMGTFVLSEGYADAYYRRAQRLRTLLRQDFERAFADVDLLATPVSPTVAFPLGARTEDPLGMYLGDVYTVPASLAGLPAVSVPCGLGAESQLPVGLQLLAPPFEEARLLRAAHAYELARGALP